MPQNFSDEDPLPFHKGSVAQEPPRILHIKLIGDVGYGQDNLARAMSKGGGPKFPFPIVQSRPCSYPKQVTINNELVWVRLWNPVPPGDATPEDYWPEGGHHDVNAFMLGVDVTSADSFEKAKEHVRTILQNSSQTASKPIPIILVAMQADKLEEQVVDHRTLFEYCSSLGLKEPVVTSVKNQLTLSKALQLAADEAYLFVTGTSPCKLQPAAAIPFISTNISTNSNPIASSPQSGLRIALNLISWPFRKLWSGLCFLGRCLLCKKHPPSHYEEQDSALAIPFSNVSIEPLAKPEGCKQVENTPKSVTYEQSQAELASKNAELRDAWFDRHKRDEREKWLPQGIHEKHHSGRDPTHSSMGY